MDKFRLLFRLGGKWDGTNYIGGRQKAVAFPFHSTYAELVSKICTVLCVDTTRFDIQIQFVTSDPKVPLIDLNDDDSYEFMKIDSPGVKCLNIETVERNNGISQLDDRNNGFEDDHNYDGAENRNYEVGEDQNIGGNYEDVTEGFPIRSDENPWTHLPVQNNVDFAFPSISQAHHIPDPSIQFQNIDWDEGIPPVSGINEAVPSNDSIGLYGIFYKKADLVRALGLYALENKFEYVVKRSDKGRFMAVCNVEGCSFMMRAKSTTREGMWVIYKFDATHSCEPNIQQAQHRRVSAATIGRLYASKVVGAKHAPSNVIQDMQHNYGVQVGYTKAWRGLECAKDLAYGTPEDSYMYLPSYFYMLERTNLGTRTHIHSVDGHFLYSFCALGASIESFRLYMRPVIIVDAAHLSGVYSGKVYAAVCADGNERIFPLAFGFGPEESNDSWEWFMHRLRDAFGQPDDLVIVSDRHLGILHAMRVVYPGVPHAFCYVHMKKNVIQDCRNPSIPIVLKSAMYAYKVEDCERYLGEIRRMNARIHNWLVTVVKRERWARAYCPKSRYTHMTSNYVESFNNAIKKARKMPITAAHEFYRALCQRWFNERREQAENFPSNLTTYANDIVETIGKKIDDRGCQVSVIRAHDVYSVYHPEEGWATVTLSTRSCECRKWDLDGIPCVHACAAARY